MADQCMGAAGIVGLLLLSKAIGDYQRARRRRREDAFVRTVLALSAQQDSPCHSHALPRRMIVPDEGRSET